MEEDLKFNIERAEGIVRLYENESRHFLELNLALISIYFIIYGLLLPIFNNWGKVLITISLIAYSISVIANIINHLIKNDTHKKYNITPTLCFKGQCERYIDCIDEKTKFVLDYKNQLKNLLKYQKNYFKRAEKGRIITLIGLIILIGGISLSIIINIIGIANGIPNSSL